MNWTTPTLVEICVGLEINGYLPASSDRFLLEIAHRH
jgi:coenzyme PQQ precursor peptide PqqA